MVVSTRNSGTATRTSNGLVFDDDTKKYIADTIATMVGGALAEINGKLAQMSTEITRLGLQQNQLANKNRGEHTKVTKIDFSKFPWFRNVYEDPMSELKNLKYETTTRAYEDAFDTLLSRVEISEPHAISLFMRGLPTEIAMRNKPVFGTNNTRLGNGMVGNSFQKLLLSLPNNHNNNVNPKPNTTVGGNNRRLTQKEYADKRAQNLCFYCDQKYVPGHKCSGQLYSLVVLPEELCEISKEDEDLFYVGIAELQAPHISLYALTSTNNFQTMRLIGTVGRNVVHILIDCGSTHNFINKNMAKKLGCDIKNTCPLAVTIANGNNLVTIAECKQFQWMFSNTIFSTDVMLLPLGGCEMVLGIQSLATLGNIRCNFKELRIDFKYNIKRVSIRDTHRSTMEWLSNKTFEKAVKQAMQAELHFMALCVFPNSDATCMLLEETMVQMNPLCQQVMDKYADVFEIPTELPPKKDHDHRILLVAGSQPSNSPFSSPIVLVKKKDNYRRMCVDYMRLNKLTIKDKFPISIIEELIDELHGLKLFTKLDLRSGYHQIRMNVEDIAMTAFEPMKAIMSSWSRPLDLLMLHPHSSH
nr:reverse transcriptase [Tanacetum cinerariifolium]